MASWMDPEEVREQKADIKAAEERLPENFWNLPVTIIKDETIQEMYKVLYQQLLDENPDRDTIETMMIERAAALYAYMRNLEIQQNYDNSNHYRQLTQLWNNMANDLRKTRTVNFDEAKIRQQISLEYIQVINKSLEGFSPEIANTVRHRLVKALEV